MNKVLFEMILPSLVSVFVDSFDKMKIVAFVDEQIARLEKHISETDTKVDDSLLPLLHFARDLFHPDSEVTQVGEGGYLVKPGKS